MAHFQVRTVSFRECISVPTKHHNQQVTIILLGFPLRERPLHSTKRTVCTCQEAEIQKETHLNHPHCFRCDLLISGRVLVATGFARKTCQGKKKPPYMGMVIPPLIGHPHNVYIKHHHWVDDHPLPQGTDGSLGSWAHMSPEKNIATKQVRLPSS